jgi:hypothetical protein
MTDSITDMIEAFIDRQLDVEDEKLLMQGGRGYNHNVYSQRLGNNHFRHHQRAPHCIYFYYVRLNTDGKLKVRHYFWPSGDPNDVNNPSNPASWPVIRNDSGAPADENLEDIIRRLALNARPSVKWVDKNPKPLPEENFENIKWRRRSWVVIFVDEAHWSLLERQPGNKKPAIVFTSGATDPACTSNETFFDAADFTIRMPIRRKPGQEDERTAVAFINHMKKNHAGDDLSTPDKQDFKFSIFFDTKYADGPGVMKVIFDPGGTNDGTPLQP